MLCNQLGRHQIRRYIMPTQTNSYEDQWILGLEELIINMTEELCSRNYIVEINPYINNELKEKKEEDNYDFYRPFDTKGIDDIRLYLEMEALLAAM